MHRFSLSLLLSTTLKAGLSTALKAGLCAFFLFGCGAIVRSPGAPSRDEKFPTDLEFVQDIVSDSFLEVFEASPLGESMRVAVVAQPSQKDDWIVRDALVRTLLEGGYALVQAEQDSVSDPEEAPYTLSFRLIDLRLECQYRGSKLWGHRRMIRRGLVGFALRLTDNRDGAVIWAKQTTGQREDVVPAAYSRMLEVPDAIPREMIEKESHTLERIVGVGIVASLGYLSL